MRVLFLIGDGMGDWPVDSLGGRTPLTAARTPQMDGLAARGLLGRARTVPTTMEPGSDVANMALLGFDPAVHHTGRGPIEAAAQGLDLGPDDLVFRLNLVTVSEFSGLGTMLDHSAGHITTQAATELLAAMMPVLAEELAAGGFEIVPGVQYRHLLIQKGGANMPEARLAVSPPHDILEKSIAPEMSTFALSPALDAVLKKAADFLASEANPTKATSLWPWGQGRPLSLPTFKETYGLSGAVISAVDLVRGLGRAAGMEVLEVEGVTGLLDTNYAGKVQAALEFFERGGEFVYLHVEAPDECGHAGDPAQKVEAIERFDSRVVGPLVAALPDTAFLVTCDHYTPLAIRTHSKEPVPFVLAAPGLAPSGGKRLTEAEADLSAVLVEPGHELLAYCLKTLKELP